MPWRVIAFVVLAFAGSTALASCGGSGGGDAANGTATPSSAATTTPTSSPTPDASADRQVARESTLKLEGLPFGVDRG